MSLASIIPLDTLEAAEERAKNDEWGQASIALPKPAKASSHWYHFLHVELASDFDFVYMEVSNTHGDHAHRVERTVTRSEARHIISGRCGPLCMFHGDPRDTSMAVPS